MNAIVCRARRYSIRRVMRCATCKTRRRMIVQDEVWYGPTVTCCHCGERWQDGERCLRSNKRGWRREAAAEATAEWLTAGPYDRKAHRTWLAAEAGVDL